VASDVEVLFWGRFGLAGSAASEIYGGKLAGSCATVTLLYFVPAAFRFGVGREDNCFWPPSLLVRATKESLSFTVTGPFPSWLP